MIITRQFINDNKTRKGAWTKKQFEALGITYPPRKGWINEMIGKEITPEQAGLFIEGKYYYSKTKKFEALKSERFVSVEIAQEVVRDTARKMDGLFPGDVARLISDQIIRELRKL